MSASARAGQKRKNKDRSSKLYWKRYACHNIFDAIWQGEEDRSYARKTLYQWLAYELDIPEENAHFSAMNEDLLRRALKLLKLVNGKSFEEVTQEYIEHCDFQDAPWRERFNGIMSNCEGLLQLVEVLADNYTNEQLKKATGSLCALYTQLATNVGCDASEVAKTVAQYNTLKPSKWVRFIDNPEEKDVSA